MLLFWQMPISSLACEIPSLLRSSRLPFPAWGPARFLLPYSRLMRSAITLPLSVSYLIIGMGLLVLFTKLGVSKSLWAAGVGHVVINLPLCFAVIYSQMGEHQANIERAARDLGASDATVLWAITAPMLWPALFAAFFLSMTFSWDEFVISFLLTRFDTTLPVEIWSLLRGGLSPKTNAVGALVFGISIAMAFAFEAVAFRRRAT
jgi:spermidine/putrescine transport system permease protein